MPVRKSNTKSENLSKEEISRTGFEPIIRNRNTKKVKCLIIAAIISFVTGGIFFQLDTWLRYPFLFITYILFSFVVAPVLGIVAAAISFQSKISARKFFAIMVIFLLSIPMLTAARMILVVLLPHVYTPPALTSQNLLIYNECIRFVKGHEEHKKLALGRGRVVINGKFYMLMKGNPFERNRARETFHEAEIIEMERLCRQLYRVRCALFQRDNDMLIFYKMANSTLPGFEPGSLSILPVAPGVVYSLEGKNPNKIDSRPLKFRKPFINISGNWYTSRHLMLAGPRSDTPASIPKSLIDYSLKIEDINFDDWQDEKPHWE